MAQAQKKKKVKAQDVAKAPEKSFDFDVAKFTSAQFKPRTAEVPVTNSDMKNFYPAGVKPMIMVRNLSALELARADEEVTLSKEAQAEKALQDIGTEAIEALRTLLRAHMEENTPGQYVKCLQVVFMGLVKPKLAYEQVIKFATAFPIEFRMAFMKINELTGRGQTLVGKPKGSGQTLESKTQ